MDQTSKLKLPYILAAQSQKHVTHNEALRVLDALVQLAVLDKDLSAPPGSPAEGNCYIVAAGPTGAWAGHASHLAAFQDGAWAFHVPTEGWRAWVCDEDLLYAYNGTGWVPNSGGGGVNPVSLVGVNATADTTNRLSVASPASLFNHDGAGHQLKINKAAAGDTGSVLFQTAFSGRAEFGLAGDDDFHVKVSADGTTWYEALVISRSSGLLRGPSLRDRLTANRTYYVRTDGSDSNTGLANTSGGAFLTIQKAINVAAALDISIYNVTIQLADGTYTGLNTVNGAWLGSGTVTVLGNTTTPANVVVTGTSAFSVTNGGRLTLSGMELQATGGFGVCAGASANGSLTLGAAMRFGTATAQHIAATTGGMVNCFSNYSIVGGAAAHVSALDGGLVNMSSMTVTLTGAPAFTNFVQSQRASYVAFYNATFSGSATGARYSVTGNSTIFTNSGANATYFPGSTSGASATGGQYL